MNTNKRNPLITIVLPAHNEEKNIAVIYEAIRDVLCFDQFEIIFVDDGSKDGTANQVLKLKKTHPEVRLIRLTRNFGHQAALIAGLAHMRGDVAITMDSDMQHPPTCLPAMIQAWKEGNHIVKMSRTATQDAPWHKRFWSWSFYKVINFLSLAPIEPGVADFQLLDRIVVREVLRIKDTRPFLRGIIGWFGFKSITFKYAANKRHAGIPTYSFKKSLMLGGRALLLVSRHPLRLGLYAGILTSFVCIAYLLFSIACFLIGYALPGWTSLITSMLFPASIQLVILGILGEYIGHIFDQTRGLPVYVVYPEITTQENTVPNEEYEAMHHL